MLRTPNIRLWLLAGAFAIMPASQAPADTLRTEVARLLQQGAALTPASLAACREQYQEIKSSAPQNARVDYAWAVVLLQQRKYAEALPVLGTCIRANPAELDAACWYVWALVQSRRYDDEIAAMRHVGRRAAEEQLSPQDMRRRAAHFLGQLFGYFELVKPGGARPEQVSKVKNELLAVLPSGLRDAIDEGRAEVAARFMSLKDDREAQLAARAAEAARRHEDAAKSLDDNRRTAADRQAELAESTEKILDVTREATVLQRQISSLSQDRLLLATQIMVAQSRLRELYGNREINIDIPGIQNPTGRGPIVEERRTNTALDLDRAARAQQLSLALAALQKQVFDIDRKLISLGTRAEQLRGVGATQSNSAAQNEAELRKAAKRADNLEKQVLRIEREKPPTFTLTTQMRSLSTYLPFPFEAEQARVLDRLDDGN